MAMTKTIFNMVLVTIQKTELVQPLDGWVRSMIDLKLV